jgi:hypothetical protein
MFVASLVENIQTGATKLETAELPKSVCFAIKKNHKERNFGLL